MSKLNDFKALFHGVYFPDMRCKGSTTALISIMLANPKAIMIVHTAHVGDDYSKQYGIDRTRFFSIRNGVLEFIGRRIEGPILVDLPAIADVLEQVRMEQAEELENMKRGTTHQKKLEELRMEKEELIRTNDKQFEELQKKVLYAQHLRTRIDQILGVIHKIDSALDEPAIDPIPEDSL
jgi:hypothetical protein